MILARALTILSTRNVGINFNNVLKIISLSLFNSNRSSITSDLFLLNDSSIDEGYRTYLNYKLLKQLS